MAAYSFDLRESLIKAYRDWDGSWEELAEQFGVSRSFFGKLLKQYRETGNLGPKPHGGGPARIVDKKDEIVIRKLIKQSNDDTLPELCEKFEEQTGKSISGPTLCRELKRMGITRKKNTSRQRA